MNLIIYSKGENQKRFRATDLKNGVQVDNLIYASLIPESRLEELKTALDKLGKDNPKVSFQIRKATKQKALYCVNC